MAAQTHTQGASAPAVFSFESHNVRTVDRNGEIWFVATDVAAALEYRDAANMVRNLDDDETGTHNVSTRSENGVEQGREVAIINESGLYAAILKSRKPSAKRFKKWITAEVLPAIRKTGRYAAPAGYRAERTREVHTGGLSREQQDAIKAHHKALVQAAPKDKQAKLAVTLWSSIKSKFGVSYKDLPADDFVNVISLMSRAAVEGEWLPPEVPPQAAVMLSEAEAHTLAGLLQLLPMFKDVQQEAEKVLRAAQSPLASRMFDAWHEPTLFYGSLGSVRERCEVVKRKMNAWLVTH